MLSDQRHVRITGPIPIPPSVNRAMSQPMTGHRGQVTSERLQRIKPKLKSSIIEIGLRKIGTTIEHSTGIRAAQEIYLEGVLS